MTESRALELAVIDLNPRKRPSDGEIAELWGLATSRSVAEVRLTEAYAIARAELTDHLISCAEEQVELIVERALDGLARLVPDLVDRTAELLDKPSSAPPEWRPNGNDVRTAVTALRLLWDLSQRGQAMPVPKEERSASPIPSLVLAESRTETVRQYRRVTFTVAPDGDTVDGEVLRQPTLTAEIPPQG